MSTNPKSLRGLEAKGDFLSQSFYGFSHWLGGLHARIKTYTEQRRNRLAFRQLLEVEDHVLADMGLSKADVMWANSLPLHVDAAKELQRLRCEQRNLSLGLKS